MAATMCSLRPLVSRRVPGTRGHQLTSDMSWVAAGLLIMASGHDGKPLDYGELERWTRLGFERGTRFRKGER
jgi:hypothetical protein